MEIWLDTSNLDLIAKTKSMGILHGVTTNPSIVAKSGLSLEDLLAKLLAAQKGPVTAQVSAAGASAMVEQGKALRAYSDRIIVKVPVTAEGLQAISLLNECQIPTMATAVFDLNQVLLAASAKAQYIAPYFSRICEEDRDGVEIVKAMLRLLNRYHYSSKIIAASLRSPEQIRECCEMGAHAVTLNEKVFHEFIEDHPQTIKTIDRFNRDWKDAEANR
jgi:transaldolase